MHETKDIDSKTFRNSSQRPNRRIIHQIELSGHPETKVLRYYR